MKASQPSALKRSLSVVGKLFAGTRKGPSGERVRQLKKLERKIGIKFTDLGLLEQALTHRSYSHVTAQTRNESNERMEFLGDSVLGLSVSQFLYLQFPDRSEGALSKMKSLLVSRKVLSLVARDSGLGEFLLLSGEESEMGGRDRSSILADSFEGVIGAIYLDQGYRAANKFVQKFLLGSIHEILKDEEHTNYKSLLQEYVQSKRLSHPVYRVRREEGPEHEKEFAIEVVVKGEVWGVGRGKNKKDAEQNAARAALESRQSRDGAAGRRRGGSAPVAGAAVAAAVTAAVEAPVAAPPSRGRAEAGGGRGERRAPRERRDREPREPREREPRNAAPQNRGEHGILASREKLRSSRREEEEQRRREEREFRQRRDERARTEPRGREETPRTEETPRPAAGRRRGSRGGSRPMEREPREVAGSEAEAVGRMSGAVEPMPNAMAESRAEEPRERVTPEAVSPAPEQEIPGTEEAPRERGFGRRRRSRRGGGSREGRSDSTPRVETPAGASSPEPAPTPPDESGAEFWSEPVAGGRGENGFATPVERADPVERNASEEREVREERGSIEVEAYAPEPAMDRTFPEREAPESPAFPMESRTSERARETERETPPASAVEDDSPGAEDPDSEPAGMVRGDSGFNRRKRRHAKGLRRR